MRANPSEEGVPSSPTKCLRRSLLHALKIEEAVGILGKPPRVDPIDYADSGADDRHRLKGPILWIDLPFHEFLKFGNSLHSSRHRLLLAAVSSDMQSNPPCEVQSGLYSFPARRAHT